MRLADVEIDPFEPSRLPRCVGPRLRLVRTEGRVTSSPNTNRSCRIEACGDPGVRAAPRRSGPFDGPFGTSERSVLQSRPSRIPPDHVLPPRSTSCQRRPSSSPRRSSAYSAAAVAVSPLSFGRSQRDDRPQADRGHHRVAVDHDVLHPRSPTATARPVNRRTGVELHAILERLLPKRFHLGERASRLRTFARPSRTGSGAFAGWAENGEGGIRTREGVLTPYSLSRRVPSATRPPLPRCRGRSVEPGRGPQDSGARD